MEYSTDDDVYFTDENGKTYQSLNDSTHYFGAELEPVSYTHLDVYKRQDVHHEGEGSRLWR